MRTPCAKAMDMKHHMKRLPFAAVVLSALSSTPSCKKMPSSRGPGRQGSQRGGQAQRTHRSDGTRAATRLGCDMYNKSKKGIRYPGTRTRQTQV